MPRRNSYARLTPNRGGDGSDPSSSRPSVNKHLNQLTDEEKQERRISWYQRRFELWIPLEADLVENNDETDSESEGFEVAPAFAVSSNSSLPQGEPRSTSRPLPISSELLVPVEEVLDHLVLKAIRKSSIRRFFLFALYMFVYFIALTMQRSLSDSFALESAIKNRVVNVASPSGMTFSMISNIVELWDWLGTSFFTLIFPEERWYNGDLINATNPAEAGYVFLYNKPVAGFELVQHRVMVGDGCELSPDFCNEFPSVWVDIDSDTTTSDPGATDTKPFGPIYDNQKYKWRPDNAGEYGGGGYMVDFPLDVDLAAYKVQELKHDRWIDKQTRKLQVVFTVYNGNLRLFAVTRLIVDFDSAGKISTSISVGSLRLDDPVLVTDWVRIGLECLVVVLALHHSWMELKELLDVRHGYFIFWNNCDVIRQLIMYVCFAQYISLRFNKLRTDLRLPIKKYTDFESLVKLESDYVQLTSINILITTFMIFRFLVPFPKLGVFVHTMARAGRDLLSFLGLLFLILAGYTMQGHVTFGHVLESYSTLSNSLESVVYLALGNYNYDELLEASSPMQANIYFYSFVVLVPIIVLNMVIAIVFSAYDSLTEQISGFQDIPIKNDIFLTFFLFRTPSIFESCMAETNGVFLTIADTWKRRALMLCRRLVCIRKSSGVKVSDSSAESIDESGGNFIGRIVSFQSSGFLDAVQGLRKPVIFGFKTFTEKHLLSLLDPDYTYRLMGTLSPSTERNLRNAKKHVRKLHNLSDDQAVAEKEKRKAVSKHALSVDEFCYLLHKLDDDDDRIQIGTASSDDFQLGASNTDEYRISELVFSLFAKKPPINVEKNFRTDVKRQIAELSANSRATAKDVSKILKILMQANGIAADGREASMRWKSSGSAVMFANNNYKENEKRESAVDDERHELDKPSPKGFSNSTPQSPTKTAPISQQISLSSIPTLGSSSDPQREKDFSDSSIEDL